MAGLSEFLSGAWYGAAKLYGLGLSAQYQMDPSGIDLPEDELTDAAIVHLVQISLCAQQVDPALHSAVQTIVDRSGQRDVIDAVIDRVQDSTERAWSSFGEGDLNGLPFSDLGNTRYIRFAALGTNWRLLASNDDDSEKVAKRFAAGVQTVLAALAREDLCLVPTKITVRIEGTQDTGLDSLKRIEALPSNEGREWRVRLALTGSSNDAGRESINTELMTVLTTILRETSLLPEEDFLAIMQRAFGRGLGHKLSAAVQLDEFVAMFSTDQDDAFSRRSVDVPWDCLAGTFATPEELRWQDGPGPTYSKEKADQLLRTRYENLARVLRITAVVLSCSEEFRPTIRTLRSEGWLDWHILTAIANITMNYRFPLSPSRPSDESMKEMLQRASNAESATEPPVPLSQFTLEQLRSHRKMSMLNLLAHWDLECHQRTPDLPAIERLLVARYGYWDEDVPHEDPFPEAD